MGIVCRDGFRLQVLRASITMVAWQFVVRRLSRCALLCFPVPGILGGREFYLLVCVGCYGGQAGLWFC